jgi:hypothetical protein
MLQRSSISFSLHNWQEKQCRYLWYKTWCDICSDICIYCVMANLSYFIYPLPHILITVCGKNIWNLLLAVFTI